MKPRDRGFVRGLLPILGGALALADNYGLIDGLSPQVWLIGFSALSALFFAACGSGAGSCRRPSARGVRSRSALRSAG